jgi:hypothetical membrane protein
MKSNDRGLLRFSWLAGIAAPVLFTFMVVVESLLRPGYSQVSDEVSDLGVGPHAVLQNANFIVCGLLCIIFALGLSASLSLGVRRAARRAGLAVEIFGVGIVLAGVSLLLSGASLGGSLTIPEIPAYYAHTVASFIAFFAIIAAQFLTWRAAKRGDRALWERYEVYSLLSGLLSVILLALFVATLFGPYQGLAERTFIAVPLIWIEVTGLKLGSMAALASKDSKAGRAGGGPAWRR